MDRGKGIKLASSGTCELEIHGSTAIEVSKFIMQDEGGRVLNELKYILIWKQEEGQWKIHRDIWNTCMPKPGQ